MTLHVTKHALDRFCERCLGIETPAESYKRRVLRKLLNKSLGDPQPGFGTLHVWGHWPAAIEGDRIVTVLEPWQRPMSSERAAARRARTAIALSELAALDGEHL